VTATAKSAVPCTALIHTGTISGIELLRRIHKGQFSLGGLRLKDGSTPVVWNAVLAA
jgi:hypothetical protein